MDNPRCRDEAYFPLSIDVLQNEKLSALADGLVSGNARVAEITGLYGTGKTSLARKFAEKFNENFPGGVYFIDPGFPNNNLLSDLVWEQTAGSPAKSLIIIDNLDVRKMDAAGEHDLDIDVRTILSERKSARVILVTQNSLQLKSVDLTVHLSGMTLPLWTDVLTQVWPAPDLKLDRDLAAWANFLNTRIEGNLESAAAITQVLKDGTSTVEQVVADIEQPLHQSGLIGLDGRPLSSDDDSYRSIITDVSGINDELIAKFADDPDLMYKILPRKFEELIAELLMRDGYAVTLTQVSRDGGKDIYAAKNDRIGSFLYVVECKRYAPHRAVPVGLVRQLYGVAQAQRAAAGIMVTTSRYTRDAINFQESVSNQLSLLGYLELRAWLRDLSPQQNA